MSEESYRVDTLGQRLDRQARQLVERRMPSCAWADPLAVLLDHLAELPTPADTRYTRVEAAPAQPAELERRHEMVGDRVDAGRALPSDVAERLRTHVGPAAAAMRVHDGEHADAVAGRHSADAVTVGADVFFRSGRYRPREPRGFGLLVHEATHVVERLQCGAPAGGASGSAAAAEERAALAAEAAVLPAPPAAPMRPGPHVPPMAAAAALPVPALVSPIGAAGTAAAVTRPAIASPPGPPAPPMAAATDRPIDPPATHTLDVDALRSTLMRDLMRQLRDEFERGG